MEERLVRLVNSWARAVLKSLYRFLIPNVAGPSNLVPLAALETKEMSVGSLRCGSSQRKIACSER